MLIMPESISPVEIQKIAASGHLRIHFSQFGEDAVLWTYLQNKKNGFYVDVGCHHPLRYSNTALLHLYNGWSGINIDVDQRAIDAFNINRPKDLNICAGVGLTAGQFDVTLFDDGALNTFDSKMAADSRWDNMGRQTLRVDVFPLRDLLAKYASKDQGIDLLNVDIEGLDLVALQSNDWSLFRPRHIAIEVHAFDLSRPTENATFSFLRANGYQLISHAFATSIYVDTTNTDPFP